MRTFLTVLLASSALLVASAQEAAPPAGPGPDPLTIVEGSLVRFVHASPNAGAVTLTVISSTPEVDERQVVELDYLESTEYERFAEGSYDIAVEFAAQDDGAMLMEEQIHTIPGGVYTVALVGLALDEPEAETDAGDGLLGWLQELFTADRPELALRALVLDDAGGSVAGPERVAYRVVHAAPGTDRVELVHVHDDGVDTLATVSYLDASGFADVTPDVGALEVRPAGATTTIDVVADVHHAPGLVHTVFVVGTPIEEEPLQSLVVTAGWGEVAPAGLGVTGAMRMTGVLSPPEVATLRELLAAFGERVESAGHHLEELEGEHDPVVEARREISTALLLLEQGHRLLDDAEHRSP